MAQEALAQIDVRLPLNARVEEMSVANKQLIAISKALRQNAQLIIMDEPTSALTEREVRALFEVIHMLQAKKGIAFLICQPQAQRSAGDFADDHGHAQRAQRERGRPQANTTTSRLVFEMTGQSIGEKAYDFTPDRPANRPCSRVER